MPWRAVEENHPIKLWIVIVLWKDEGTLWCIMKNTIQGFGIARWIIVMKMTINSDRRIYYRMLLRIMRLWIVIELDCIWVNLTWTRFKSIGIGLYLNQSEMDYIWINPNWIRIWISWKCIIFESIGIGLGFESIGIRLDLNQLELD